MFKKATAVLLIICLLLIEGLFTVGFADSEPLIYYGFEGNNEGWSYWGGNASNTYPVSEASATGSRALFVRDATTTGTAGIKSGYFDITSGTTYTLLASGYIIKSKITVYLRFYDSSNAQLSSKTVTFTESRWVEKAITDTAPANAEKGQLIICTTTTDIAGAYIDDVCLYEGEISAKGNFTGHLPSQLPVIEEETEEIEIIDDGYEDGERIYFQSFENGADDWTSYIYSNAFSISDNNATNGDYSLYIKDYLTDHAMGAKSGRINVRQGNTYTLYFDAYIHVTGISVYVNFYNSSNASVGQSSLSLPSAGWHNKRITVTAPEGTSYLQILITGNVVTTGEGYFDNIRLYKGNFLEKTEETSWSAPVQNTAVNAFLAAPSGGKLSYAAYNDKGDKISDFSYAGFYGGQVELPDTSKLPLMATLTPSGTEDDTAMIQNAVDNAATGLENGTMGVVKLRAGKYYINKNGIDLKSGIVLSGEGQGPSGTVLYAKDPENYDVIEAFGNDARTLTTKINITDNYVPSGSKVIHVEDSSLFNPGDLIRIVHPSSADWIAGMKMNNVLNVYGNLLSWQVDALTNSTERTITAINGNELTLDYGLFIPYDKTYSQSYIFSIAKKGRLHDIGVENLRVVSAFNGDPYDLNHAKMAIYVKRVENMFVRNVTAKNMYNGVFGCRAYSKHITVQNCSNLDPVSTIEGGNRYPFYADIDSEKILFTGCYSYDGRHDYMAVKGTSGPIVFSDNVADMSNACSETHAEFATGVLYDNIYQITDKTNGNIGFPNRGYYGTETPQGWTAAGCVAWNCLSSSIIANKPPLSYQNFIVGVWGIYNTPTTEEIKQSQIDSYKNNAYRYEGVNEGPDSAFATQEGTPVVGDVYKEAEFTPVNPRSLFKAQLAERLTGNISNAKPNSPIIVYPRPDKEVGEDNKLVAISGIYENGADNVSVYIDDVKYTAQKNTEDNTFSLSLALEDGVHKIYATQTINGDEGNKTADRFITVGEPGAGNPSYLQSNYSVDKTSLIKNDNRLTYDEYIDENYYFYTAKLQGKGTDASPYIIDTADKFLSVFMNGSTKSASSVYLLTGFDESPLELPGYYKPISTEFSGKLIGGDKGKSGDIIPKIQKIQFNIETGKSVLDTDYLTFASGSSVYKTQGVLFHKLSGAEIRNIALYGLVSTLNTPSYFGVLAGRAVNSTLENVHNYANVTGDQARSTGGLVGLSGDHSVITNCSNHGNITVPHATTARADVGGIVGNMTVTDITDCYNYGNIQGRDNAGGIAGYSNCAISNCGNFGNISCTREATYGYAGGISGRSNGGNISNCFNAGDITSVKYAGGLYAHIPSGKTTNVTNCFNMGKINGTVSSGLVIGINLGNSTISGFYDLGNPSVMSLAGTNSGNLTVRSAYGYSETASAQTNDVNKVSFDYLFSLPSANAAYATSGRTPYTNCRQPFIVSDTMVDDEGNILSSSGFSSLDSLSLGIAKLCEENITAVFVAAFYDNQGKLIHSAFTNKTLTEHMEKVDIAIGEDVSSAYKYKIIILNSFDLLKPIYPAYEKLVSDV